MVTADWMTVRDWLRDGKEDNPPSLRHSLLHAGLWATMAILFLWGTRLDAWFWAYAAAMCLAWIAVALFTEPLHGRVFRYRTQVSAAFSSNQVVLAEECVLALETSGPLYRIVFSSGPRSLVLHRGLFHKRDQATQRYLGCRETLTDAGWRTTALQTPPPAPPEPLKF